MADVFVSFASEDRDRVAPLVRALEDAGYSVWWSDRNIRPGLSFQKAISDAMTAAGCVVVCWTKTSVKKEWVFEEASEGKERDILVPVMLESVRPPIGLRAAQQVDLTGWDGQHHIPALETLFTAVAAIIGRPADAATPAPDTRQATDDPAGSSRPARVAAAGNRRALVIGAGVAAIAAVVAVLVATRTVQIDAPPATSVAVLPFVDMSLDGAQSRLGDNIALELHSKLGFLRNVRLSSRATSFAYRDSGLDVREVGRDMAVAYIVEGTIRRAGGHVRVTMQLVSVADGYQIWSDVYDQRIDEQFGTEIEIASRAAVALSEQFGAELNPTLRIEDTQPADPAQQQPSLESLFEQPDSAFPQVDAATFGTIGGDAEPVTREEQDDE